MKRCGYILLLLVSIGAMFLAPKRVPVGRSDRSVCCIVQSAERHALAGIHGEPLTVVCTGNMQVSVATCFSYSAQRVQFGKHRTRTAFLRKMIRHYQPIYLVFRGKERLETSPFAASVGSVYYVYCLRRILC